MIRATADEPDTVFVSIWDPRVAIRPILADIEGVRAVEERTTTITGATGGRTLRNFAIRTDGEEGTEERIENALAFAGSLVQADRAPDVRRRWLAPWLRVRSVAEGAIAAALSVAWLAILVSSADRAIEQRRMMATLVAMGMHRSSLRRAVMVQVMVPLTVAVALGLGMFLPVTALVFAAAGEPLVVPVRYAGWLALALVTLWLATTVAALPLIRGLVAPEALRAE